jgi:hypothetical protein
MFFGIPDPHQDPLVTSTDPEADPAPDPSFSDKSVEQTEIMVAKYKNFLPKNLILIIKHIFTVLKL